MTVCWMLGVELISLVHCNPVKTTLFPLFLKFLWELTLAATEILEGQLSILSNLSKSVPFISSTPPLNG
jgi:hypothetical protein